MKLDTGITAPEIVDVVEPEVEAVWRDYSESGVPSIISSVNMAFVIRACWTTGLAEKLINRASLDELVEGLDLHTATNLLRYLALRGLVVETNDAPQLTPWGRSVFSDVSIASLGFYLEGYGPVIQRADDLLSGRVRYGQGLSRNVRALTAHHASLFHRFYTPIVLQALQGISVSSLLDLGCGAGPLLIDTCMRHPTLRGVGLDISEDAIALARESSVQNGLSDRLQFFVADAFDPESWPSECLQADAMCAVGVLHEHFRTSEDAVVDLLNRYSGLLQDSMKTLLLGEAELRYDDRENDSDLFLVHALSGQGFPRRRELWLDVFAKSQLRCRRVFSRPGSGPLRLVFYDLVAS